MVLSYQLLSIGVDEMPVRKKHQKTLQKALALEVIDRLKRIPRCRLYIGL